jgi:phosphoribosylformimino-5-aminoimidazole carboxamide ribotide isomerase
MLIIPAIDLKNGKCVRLLRGEADRETIYGDDPAAMARGFQEQGARRLHLVDLDGAFRGGSANLEGVRAVRAAVDIPIELGGGIRTLEDVRRMLALGMDAVVVGTMAVKAPADLEAALAEFPGERVILGVDSRAGRVAVEGWVEATELDDVDFARHWAERGARRVIYTDIARDGMLSGPNLPALRKMAEGSGLKVTASGGVSSPEDLAALRALEPFGVDSVITGKAIYEGRINLREALRC